ncbi:MAG: hypothetical protein ACPGYY_08590 [Bacteroidia bacterium]
MKTRLLFGVLMLFSIKGFAQHRIKLKTNRSVFANITELAEDAVYFSFLRQTEVYKIQRSEIDVLQSLVWDPLLLENNFKLDAPYVFQNFQLNDEIVLNKYLKFNKLNYRKLNSKVLYLSKDSVFFITFLDSRYTFNTLDKSNISVINYGESNLEYLTSLDSNISHMDKVTNIDGEEQDLYIYEIGYQGIKYGEKAIPGFITTFKDGQVKYGGMVDMKFMPYSDIDKIETAQGYVFLAKFYIPERLRRETKLKVYPKLEISIGSGYVKRYKAENIGFNDNLHYNGELVRKTDVGDMSYMYSLIDIKTTTHVSKHAAVVVGYDFSTSENVEYHDTAYSQDGGVRRGVGNYQTRLHTFRLGARYNLHNVHVSMHANTVLTRSPFAYNSLTILPNGTYNNVTYEAFFKSKSYIRYGGEIGYTFHFGKLGIIPSVGYEVFKIDYRDTDKDVLTSSTSGDTNPGFPKGGVGIQSFRTKYSQSLSNWEIMKANLSFSYKF